MLSNSSNAGSKSLGNVNVEFDTAKNTITLSTERKTKKGHPMVRWELNTDEGEIVETTNSDDGE